ncbi:histidine kinase [Aphanothece hegewaldii CCALA 016]|uniref:Histidine kinase n=1 Tax=Aphanothece hegewaldii CCALA 016 TaxID=2107694 RepID=A0A2T1LWQ5_9CHRO|nr:Hpt domain-containing protein [Aphanothece hegewaldii]PSF36266.1 histidine kinase [Aphanothece hegewaldii CCALA 016]
MDNVNTQKILGFFIEESKEHLETIEQGILNLSATANDAEQVNEMFRAAHSIKGGAAMLGYNRIQKTAHRLEDAFKVLREHRVTIDQKLESLLLKSYDALNELIEKLQGPFGLQDDEAEAIISQVEPTFGELQNHLASLLTPSGVPKTSPNEKVQKDWGTKVRDLLKQMLQLFKLEANTATRQQLQNLCTQLGQLAPHDSGWQKLIKMAQTAIANPKHSYHTLAPVIIKELKLASDFIELGQNQRITPSTELQYLAAAKLPQILVTLEPKSVANTLLQMFNQQQVSQIIQLLQSAQ